MAKEAARNSRFKGDRMARTGTAQGSSRLLVCLVLESCEEVIRREENSFLDIFVLSSLDSR